MKYKGLIHKDFEDIVKDVTFKNDSFEIGKEYIFQTGLGGYRIIVLKMKRYNSIMKFKIPLMKRRLSIRGIIEWIKACIKAKKIVKYSEFRTWMDWDLFLGKIKFQKEQEDWMWQNYKPLTYNLTINDWLKQLHFKEDSKIDGEQYKVCSYVFNRMNIEERNEYFCLKCQEEISDFGVGMWWFDKMENMVKELTNKYINNETTNS